MAVKIRLKRMGKIRAPYYRIVVADSRTKRDGRVIEEIGVYHPTQEPSIIEVKSERAQYWLGVGAQPTEQVAALLKLTGDWGIFKGDLNAKSTVKFKEAKVVFVADEKKKPVLKPKAEKPAVKEEAPAAVPVEARAEGPAEDEPEAPVKAAVKASVKAPAEKSAEASVEAPVVESVEASVEESAEASAEKATKAPAKAPAEKATKASAKAPVEAPAQDKA